MAKVVTKWSGDAAIAAVIKGAVMGLSDAAEHVLTEATKTVPLNEGILLRSGDTSVDKVRLQSSVYYDTPYAGSVHEGPNRRWRRPDARAKWLQLTLQEQSGKITPFLEKAMRGVL